MHNKGMYHMIKLGQPHGTHLEVFNKIKQLSHKYGYCYADNRYIAEELALSISRVSHIISELYEAHLVERDITYKPGMKQVDKRLLRPVAANVARGIAKNDQEQTVSANINIKPDSSPKVKAVQMGINLGINLMITTGMIAKYGVEYVTEKLHIVASSLSVKNRTALFISACQKDYQASKKAVKALTNKAYSTPIRKSTNIATVSVPEEIKSVPLSENQFLKDYLSMHSDTTLAKIFRQKLAMA